MKARDVMTRHVRTARSETPVARIAGIMCSHKISALPIVDRQKHVIGIVSEGDLLRRVEGGTVRRPSWWTRLMGEPDSRARDYIKTRGRLARDVMTREIVSVTEDTDVAEIADLFESWGIKRVPVVRGGKLVGLVARSDLLRAVGRAGNGKGGRKLSDADIREGLRREIDGAPWLGSALVNFVVRKGHIELSGIAASPAQRLALRVMAENLVGPRAVKDRLSVMPRAMY